MNFDTVRSESSEFDYLDSEIESREDELITFNELVELETNMGKISNYVKELEKKCENYEKRLKKLENREESEDQKESTLSKASIDFDKVWKSIRSSSIEILKHPPDGLNLNTPLVLLPVSYFIFKSGKTSKKDLDAQEVIMRQLSAQLEAIKEKKKRPKPEFLEDFQQISNFAPKIQELRKNLAILEARLRNSELTDQVDSLWHRLITLIRDQELTMSQMRDDYELDQRFEARVQKISTEIQNFKMIINSTSNESIMEQIPKFQNELDAIRDYWYIGKKRRIHLEADPTSFNVAVENYNSLLTDRVEKIWSDNAIFARLTTFVLKAIGF